LCSQLARFRKSWWYSIIVLLYEKSLLFSCFVCCILTLIITMEQEFHNTERNFWHFVECSTRLYLLQKRAERKLLPFLTLFPISFVFPLFYCVEKQSFKSGLCISLFCTFCVLNVMTNKSRDEPTSLSIASTISLLPPSFSTTGILCFKNTGELDHESCFSSFFGCESSSLLHCTTVEIGKISSRGELDKRQQFWKPCSISQNT